MQLKEIRLLTMIKNQDGLDEHVLFVNNPLRRDEPFLVGEGLPIEGGKHLPLNSMVETFPVPEIPSPSASFGVTGRLAP